MRPLVTLIGLVITTPVASALGQNAASEERTVKEAVLAVPAALNARDYARAAALFAEDADLMMPGGPRVSGREAIRDMWQRAREEFPDCRVTLAIQSVRFTGADAAVVDATAELSSCAAANDRATYVMARRGSNWEVAALRVMPAEARHRQPASPASADDAVNVSPNLYTVLLDNEHVRVLEYRAPPGTKEPTHSHPPGAAYFLSDTRTRSSMPDGTSQVFERKAGTAAWGDAVTHTFEVLGPADHHVIIVEAKHQAATAARAEGDEDEIRRLVVEGWCQAEKAQDIEAKLRLYTADAVLMPPGTPNLVGLDAIRAEAEERWTSLHWACTGTVDEVQIFGDRAIAWGSFTGVATPREGAPWTGSGKFLDVFIRAPDGSWKIDRGTWNHPPSPGSQQVSRTGLAGTWELDLARNEHPRPAAEGVDPHLRDRW
jgi:uncharacterized protein (TIGR02246 family)